MESKIREICNDFETCIEAELAIDTSTAKNLKHDVIKLIQAVHSISYIKAEAIYGIALDNVYRRLFNSELFTPLELMYSYKVALSFN
jgi:hypothetical protein